MPITEDNIEEFFDDFLNQVSADVKKATLMVERDAKILCPVKTSTLKRSITHKFIDKITAIVGSNMEYAPSVELGSRPHIIRPKTAKALHFKIGGKDIFTKEVQHPGWSGKPFLRPALAKNRKTIEKLFR